MNTFSDWCKILGVSETATQLEIKKAYKKLALQCHPDKFKQDQEVHEKFCMLNQAYNMLIGLQQQPQDYKEEKEQENNNTPTRIEVRILFEDLEVAQACLEEFHEGYLTFIGSQSLLPEVIFKNFSRGKEMILHLVHQDASPEELANDIIVNRELGIRKLLVATTGKLFVHLRNQTFNMKGVGGKRKKGKKHNQ